MYLIFYLIVLVTNFTIWQIILRGRDFFAHLFFMLKNEKKSLPLEITCHILE